MAAARHQEKQHGEARQHEDRAITRLRGVNPTPWRPATIPPDQFAAISSCLHQGFTQPGHPRMRMKTKDTLIVALVPLVLLLIPLAGSLTVEGWNWKWHDFLMAWAVFTFTTWFLRFLVTRPVANFAYKAGAALAVITGFLITWITMAVQIIGDDNPGNGLYLLTILGGFIGVGLARFRPAGLAWVAFTMAVVLVAIPAVSVLLWPGDFNPGYPKAQILSTGFAAMFTVSGLLFRHAAGQNRGNGEIKAA
jgi:hypothetical protein